MRIRRVSAVFLAAAFVAGFSLALPQMAQAAVTPDPSWNEIIWPDILARSNVMCLDDPGGSTQVVNLETWHCHGSGSDGAPQRWQFIPVATAPDGRTAYVIRNTGSHLCLDTFLGAIQFNCPLIGSGSATVWLIRDGSSVAPAQFELELGTLSNGTVSPSHQCLTALNTSDVNGTAVIWDVGCAPFNDQRQMLTLG